MAATLEAAEKSALLLRQVQVEFIFIFKHCRDWFGSRPTILKWVLSERVQPASH